MEAEPNLFQVCDDLGWPRKTPHRSAFAAYVWEAEEGEEFMKLPLVRAASREGPLCRS